jgi:hypothetical protein
LSGRTRFTEVMQRVFLVAQEYQHEREILHITIGAEGREARGLTAANSIARGVLQFSGRGSTRVARTGRSLQIRGNFVAVTKTAYVIEELKTCRPSETAYDWSSEKAL